MQSQITARKLLTEAEEVDYPVVTMHEGKIVSIESGMPGGSHPFEGTLTAAFFDIHVHGACSFDFMSATPAQIDSVGRFLAQRGVAHYLPTTVTGPIDGTLRALEALADAIEASHSQDAFAVPVGIHLEGPFVSHAKRGVHPAAFIQEPTVELFERFQDAARGHIRLMTLAPELPHSLELIHYATSRGVRVSMGHSNATMQETLAAIAAGATSSTHLFNAMRPLDHREPGIVGTILDSDHVYAEAICDGVHVHPALIRLWLQRKGADRGILVTDGMSATGMPDGLYALGDLSVEVKDGVCLSGKSLAGSVLTMDKAVTNLREFTGTSLHTAARLAAHNPARMMGMEELVSMSAGGPANFNLYDDSGLRVGSWLHGRKL